MKADPNGKIPVNLFCDVIFGVRMRNLLNLLTSKGLLKKPTSSIKGSNVKKLSKVFFLVKGH